MGASATNFIGLRDACRDICLCDVQRVLVVGADADRERGTGADVGASQTIATGFWVVAAAEHCGSRCAGEGKVQDLFPCYSQGFGLPLRGKCGALNTRRVTVATGFRQLCGTMSVDSATLR